jgi:glutamine amidotransferase
MSKPLNSTYVAIVDYGLGNLYSVKQACAFVGLDAAITSNKNEIASAQAVILPGVGAFSDAMTALHRLDLVTFLKQMVETGKPFLGICLGMQLLMTESFEFGLHQGLDIVPGRVIRFSSAESQQGMALKVPHVGWSRIFPADVDNSSAWEDSLLRCIPAGDYMYFVHSFHCVPVDTTVSVALAQYGRLQFCASLRYRNIFGCQYHPERSGAQGLKIYDNLRKAVVSQL